jgi:hypothetical protein
VAHGLDYEVAFLEGFPVKRTGAASESDLAIGDMVRPGDTVITHKSEFVELQTQGQVLKIKEDTVFTIFEKEVGKGKKSNYLACLLGSIRLAVSKSAGVEPNLATNSAVCGVRGTELTLMAGADGSSLIVVLEGLVAVEAGGQVVELARGEGVEVATGAAPGEKFQALDKEIDFSAWDQQKLAGMLADPVQAALNIEKRLNGYADEIKKIYPLWLDVKGRMEAEQARLSEMNRKAPDNKEALNKQYSGVVFPLEQEYDYLYLNIRFYALSSLSLRRFVLGRLYIQLKSQFIAEPANLKYTNFLTAYNRILAQFENDIAQNFLVQADI